VARIVSRYHLRLADVGLDIEFALHAIDDDLKVQLTHSGDDRLAGFLIRMHAEGGSSFARRCSATPIFSWSTLVFGSTATEMTGTGKIHLLKRNDLLKVAQRVAVKTSFKPTAAAMSPARTSLISVRSLACICRSRPMRSFLPLVGHVNGIAPSSTCRSTRGRR